MVKNRKALYNSSKNNIKITKNNSVNHAQVNRSLNKKLGQHLLNNPSIIQKIVVACEIKPTDTVLEIGPGTGNLTIKILPLAKKVLAIDIDESMISDLRKRLMSQGYSNIELKIGDALNYKFGSFDVCAANLPYQISSPFMFKLIAHRPLFRTAVLMFQTEFAQRLLAKPGDKLYGRLSINTQLFCRVQCVCKVKACNFKPPPKVDSMIVKLNPIKPVPEIDFYEWDQLLRVCFIRKRKTLSSIFNIKSILASLENNYNVFCNKKNITTLDTNVKNIIINILKDTQFSDRRAVNLTTEDFFQLLYEFHKKYIYFHNVMCNDSENVE